MENTKLNIRDLGSKFRSKNEIYRFLTSEADMHLPPQKEWSIYFVRDILSGIKRVRKFSKSIICFRHFITMR